MGLWENLGLKKRTQQDLQRREEQATLKGERGFDAWNEYMERGRPTDLDPNDLYQSADAIDSRMKGISGPSAWGQMLLQRQGLAEQKAQEDLAGQIASTGASARAGMAMRGGLQAGQASSLARDQMKNAALGQQGMQRDFASQRQGIMAQDYQNQMGQVNAWGQMLAQDNAQKNSVLNANKTREFDAWKNRNSNWNDLLIS